MPQTLPNSSAHVQQAVAVRAWSGLFAAPRAVAERLLALWHLTSVDAPTVAVVWTLAFAWAASIRLPYWIPVLLALAAWSVYIGDRVLDARSALKRGAGSGLSALSELKDRHLFHHRHRRVLLPLAACAAGAAAAIVITRMPTLAREPNGLLACAALAYFTTVHSAAQRPAGRAAKPWLGSAWTRSFSPARFFNPSRVFNKELLVGLVFTAACALPTLNRAWAAGSPHLWPLAAAALLYAMLAWLNCHSIDRWEDALRNGRSGIAPLAGLLALAACALAGVLAPGNPRVSALMVAAAASSLLLALLDNLRGRLTPVAVRALADLVLLMPLVLLASAVPLRR